MDANVSITGNLGTDVDVVRKDGWCGGRFRIAQTPRYLRDGQWSDGETTWMSVRVSGRLAENCERSLRKGDPVVVAGRLRTQAWITEDGTRHEQLVIQASSVGHDLQRGVSTFIRPAPRPEEAPIAEPGEVVSAVVTELLTDRSPGSPGLPDGSERVEEDVEADDFDRDASGYGELDLDELEALDLTTGEIRVG